MEHAYHCSPSGNGASRNPGATGQVKGTGAEVVTVPVLSLRPADSPRLNGEDKAHIARLAETDAPLPPILVDRRTLRVIDGMHRLMAASLQSLETIEVVFFDGSEADVFLRAVQENVMHGLPLSLADRRAAAERIVTSHPQMSDRAIGRTTGLAAKTVAAIRKRTCDQTPQSGARVGADGRVRPLDSEKGRLARCGTAGPAAAGVPTQCSARGGPIRGDGAGRAQAPRARRVTRPPAVGRKRRECGRPGGRRGQGRRRCPRPGFSWQFAADRTGRGDGLAPGRRGGEVAPRPVTAQQRAGEGNAAVAARQRGRRGAPAGRDHGHAAALCRHRLATRPPVRGHVAGLRAGTRRAGTNHRPAGRFPARPVIDRPVIARWVGLLLSGLMYSPHPDVLDHSRCLCNCGFTQLHGLFTPWGRSSR